MALFLNGSREWSPLVSSSVHSDDELKGECFRNLIGQHLRCLLDWPRVFPGRYQPQTKVLSKDEGGDGVMGH